MKKLLVFCVLMLAGSVAAQQRVVSYASEYKAFQVTLSLVGSDRDTVFVLFPTYYDPYYSTPSETRPTASSTQLGGVAEWIANGDVGVSVRIDSVGSVDESDSLHTYIVPLDFYRTSTLNSSGSVKVVSNMTSYVDYTTGTLAASDSYLNWADGTHYGFSLAGALWPFRGFAIIFWQEDNDAGSATTTCYVNINIPR